MPPSLLTPGSLAHGFSPTGHRRFCGSGRPRAAGKPFKKVGLRPPSFWQVSFCPGPPRFPKPPISWLPKTVNSKLSCVYQLTFASSIDEIPKVPSLPRELCYDPIPAPEAVLIHVGTWFVACLDFLGWIQGRARPMCAQLGHAKVVWLDIFGPVFLRRSADFDPKTPLDRRGPGSGRPLAGRAPIAVARILAVFQGSVRIPQRAQLGYLKEVWLEIVGPVFFMFSAESLMPKTPPDRRCPHRSLLGLLRKPKCAHLGYMSDCMS